jgi:hypothetical protein
LWFFLLNTGIPTEPVEVFAPWEQDGDLLAVITDKSANLLVWDANNSKSQWLDTGQ